MGNELVKLVGEDPVRRQVATNGLNLASQIDRRWLVPTLPRAEVLFETLDEDFFVAGDFQEGFGVQAAQGGSLLLLNAADLTKCGL